MGSNTSKINTEIINRSHRNDVDSDLSSDPRSPTPEISRTPLHGKTGNKHNITKNADLRKTFEGSNDEKLIHNNPILSAVIKNHLQSYDPRSPTQEFDRTPIVIAPKVSEITQSETQERLLCGSPSLRNDDDNSYIENNIKPVDGITVTKNLCNDFFDMTLDDTLRDTDAPLGSSTASNNSIENDIASSNEKPKELLETNFDFIESNDGKEEIKASNENDMEPLNIAQRFKILEHDPRSPSTGIDRTPIIVPKDNDDSGDDNNVEEMSDDSLIKALQSTNTELKHSVNGQQKNTEGLLIYEDEAADIDINSTPKKSKSVCTSGSRTPLSCVKNKEAGHARSKSANTDAKEQKKIMNKRVSHIPRLKSLSKQVPLLSGSSISLKSANKVSGIIGDCENTPPNSHRDSWDKDNSIVL